MKDNPELITTTESSFDSEPHPLTFAEKQHKKLVAELKNLYTAITRAKCNLWIYDSDEMKRLPMFDYWQKRGLVKVIQENEIHKGDYSVVITGTSSVEKWEKLGEYFRKKQLWEPAMKCYERAGNSHLENEAKAYYHYKQAQELVKEQASESKALYVKAALAFLDSDRACHNQMFLRHAAKCLKSAKKFTEAGTLYCMLDMVSTNGMYMLCKSIHQVFALCVLFSMLNYCCPCIHSHTCRLEKPSNNLACLKMSRPLQNYKRN